MTVELANIETRELLAEVLKRTDRQDEMQACLLPTSTLLYELLSRFDHAAFVGLRCRAKHNLDHMVRRYRGNTHTICGLMMDAQTDLINTYHDGEREADESGDLV